MINICGWYNPVRSFYEQDLRKQNKRKFQVQMTWNIRIGFNVP